MDTNNNIDDWSDKLSKEFDDINRIISKEEHLKGLNVRLQELDPNNQDHKVNIEGINKEIENAKKNIDDLRKNIDPMVKCTLDNEEKFKNEYISHVEKEIELNRILKTKLGQEIKAFVSKTDYEKSVSVETQAS